MVRGDSSDYQDGLPFKKCPDKQCPISICLDERFEQHVTIIHPRNEDFGIFLSERHSLNTDGSEIYQGQLRDKLETTLFDIPESLKALP